MNYRSTWNSIGQRSGTTVEWDLEAETGFALRNRQAGGRGAKAWHPNGVGSVGPASGAAGFAKAVGPDVFRTQLWFSTGTLHQAGSSPGAAVHRPTLSLVR